MSDPAVVEHLGDGIFRLTCDQCHKFVALVSINQQTEPLEVTFSIGHIIDGTSGTSGTSADHPLRVETSKGDYAEWVAVEWDSQPVMFDASIWQERLDA